MLRNLKESLVACVLAAAAMLSPPASADKISATRRYVEEFYPLWFTYYQSLYASTNRLVGPDRISPLYQIVVAINNDTLYASTFLDLAAEPVVLTVPATKVRYSVLTLDTYGNIFDSGISTTSPGTYAITGPGFSGSVPDGTTPIALPYDHMVIIFRADKYSSAGKNQKALAEAFRRSILMQTLSNWQADPTAGQTAILPELFFAAPFKLAADTEIKRDPLAFLKQLQAAVASPNTPPLSDGQKTLSDRFDKLFAEGTDLDQFAAGTQAAHAEILQDYLTHTDANNWIHFADMGHWDSDHKGVLDRAAITEFIQYGNNRKTAAYFHAFKDGSGAALDGANGYAIHIAKDRIPEAQRFWSFTAYTPETIELVPNKAKRYEIASYSKGLTYDGDGSLTLHLAQTQPAGVPEANWLPVPNGPFNIMLRVYGPEGDVKHGDYTPPAIVKN